VQRIERRLQQWHRQDEASRRLAEIPGVGVLGATAALATIGDAQVFRSGREFAAWLGLVPRQSGTGGRVRLLGIRKRGDPYLRTVLIHGARAVMTHSKAPPEWVRQVAERRPKNVAIVALANKWNSALQVTEVNPSMLEYVAGPRIVSPNFGQLGGGVEYRIGGFP